MDASRFSLPASLTSDVVLNVATTAYYLELAITQLQEASGAYIVSTETRSILRYECSATVNASVLDGLDYSLVGGVYATRAQWQEANGVIHKFPFAEYVGMPPAVPPPSPPPPRLPLPPLSPPLPCAGWCPLNTKPWAELCTFSNCGGCLECYIMPPPPALPPLQPPPPSPMAPPPPCAKWCPSATQSWAQKCTFANCAGCAQCY
eukprot:6949448-Prymnesium_polylepis.1